MTWWQALIIALATYAVTKGVDVWVSLLSEKREFRKRRRDLALSDIEKLKDEVGALYELAANWRSYESKRDNYAQAFEADHLLIGRMHKYGDVAKAAKDTVHWCKIVASEEQEGSSGTTHSKSKLAEKHKQFLAACEEFLDAGLG